jgi:hypothetical protein
MAFVFFGILPDHGLHQRGKFLLRLFPRNAGLEASQTGQPEEVMVVN